MRIPLRGSLVFVGLCAIVTALCFGLARETGARRDGWYAVPRDAVAVIRIDLRAVQRRTKELLFDHLVQQRGDCGGSVARRLERVTLFFTYAEGRLRTGIVAQGSMHNESVASCLLSLARKENVALSRVEFAGLPALRGSETIVVFSDSRTLLAGDFVTARKSIAAIRDAALALHDDSTGRKHGKLAATAVEAWLSVTPPVHARAAEVALAWGVDARKELRSLRGITVEIRDGAPVYVRATLSFTDHESPRRTKALLERGMILDGLAPLDGSLRATVDQTRCIADITVPWEKLAAMVSARGPQ